MATTHTMPTKRDTFYGSIIMQLKVMRVESEREREQLQNIKCNACNANLLYCVCHWIWRHSNKKKTIFNHECESSWVRERERIVSNYQKGKMNVLFIIWCLNLFSFFLNSNLVDSIKHSQCPCHHDDSHKAHLSLFKNVPLNWFQ